MTNVYDKSIYFSKKKDVNAVQNYLELFVLFLMT